MQNISINAVFPYPRFNAEELLTGLSMFQKLQLNFEF